MIGEAPSANGDRTDPIGGRAERVLCELAGFDDLGSRFLRTNLISDWPGPNGKGSAWPRDVARERAMMQASFLTGHRPAVVLLGKRVADAFGVDSEYFVWREPDLIKAPHVVIPHPSGVNRALNDPDVRRRTGEVLNEAVRKRRKKEAA